MRRDWLDERGKDVVKKIYTYLTKEMRDAVDTNFEKHSPMYSFAKLGLYSGEKFDLNEQRKYSMADYYLYEPLHKDIICKKLEEYLIGPPSRRRGLAILITRYGLKTYLCVLNLCSWWLTRQRILFDDYTTSRVVSATVDEAVRRAEEIKNLFQTCEPLRELYPEMAIPPDVRWGDQTEWNIPGREASSSKSLDPSMRALGVGSTEQGSHPVLTVFDDVEGKDHARSQAIRDESEEYMKVFKFSTDIGNDRNILVGTFYHPASVHAKMVEANKLAEKEGRIEGTWDVVLLPCILDEGTPQARPLYPTRLSFEVIESLTQEEIATNGTDLAIRMQCYLDFRANTKYAFDMERWHEFDLEAPIDDRERDLVKALADCPIFVQSDFAGKDEGNRGTGDSNVSWLVAYPRLEGQVQLVVLDCLYDNTSTLDEASLGALDMATTNGAWGLIAEESTAHKVVGQALHRLSKERGYRYYQRLGSTGKEEGNIRSLKPRGSAVRGVGGISSWKMGRMLKFKGIWNAGQVWMVRGTEGLDVLRSQLFDFPFLSGHDDHLDSLCLGQDERVAEMVPIARARAPLRRAITAEQPITRYTGLVKRRY